MALNIHNCQDMLRYNRPGHATETPLRVGGGNDFKSLTTRVTVLECGTTYHVCYVKGRGPKGEVSTRGVADTATQAEARAMERARRYGLDAPVPAAYTGSRE